MNKKMIIILIISLIAIIIVGILIYFLANNKGTLVIESDLKKINVEINSNKYSENTPFKMSLKSGTYEIKVSQENYADYNQQIEIKRGKITKINAKLELDPGLKDQLIKIINPYVKAHSGKGLTFEIKGLKIENNEAEATIIPTNSISESATIVLKKENGKWEVTSFGTE